MRFPLAVSVGLVSSLVLLDWSVEECHGASFVATPPVTIKSCSIPIPSTMKLAARLKRRCAFFHPLQQQQRFSLADNRRRDKHQLSMVPPEAADALTVTATLASVAADSAATTAPLSSFSGDVSNQQQQLSVGSTIAIFLVGVFPFAWAAYEFWRRIAVGATFGTGKDSVVFVTDFDDQEEPPPTNDIVEIGEDNNPASSRGRRVLGKGALLTAYALFAIAAAVLILVLYSVVTTATMAQPFDPSTAAATATSTTTARITEGIIEETPTTVFSALL